MKFVMDQIFHRWTCVMYFIDNALSQIKPIFVTEEDGSTLVSFNWKLGITNQSLKCQNIKMNSEIMNLVYAMSMSSIYRSTNTL